MGDFREAKGDEFVGRLKMSRRGSSNLASGDLRK